ncbi:hypothetical protein AcW1_000108 [Taiwanofungus camphoratus]|nr:hypothetical protein AcW2_001400 [Antrodia cinnamomea]KAI0960862.1 hypothetical protein AcV7_000122 [Antrodia cinnamomea]KAI0962859.1 hypothetical protein AcW1_000108 [Antrodia cinnamomea]
MAPTTNSTGAQPPPTTAPATTSSSRSRPQASRKKAHVPADDAAYHASASISTSGVAGTKRAAGERAEGEPRVKRKRVETSGPTAGILAHNGASSGGANASGSAARKERTDADGKVSLIDFSTLPIAALHEYLVQFDLVPDVDPSPLSAEDPPPPSSLLRPRMRGFRRASTASPGPSLPITPANRPRREAAGRRRSARLVEDERAAEETVVPVLNDVADVHGALATVVQRHFREHAVKEVDTLASFMCAVKAKARMTT